MEEKKIKILQFLDTYYPVVDGAINAVKNYTQELNKIDSCDLAVPNPAKSDAGYSDQGESFKVYRCASSSAPENYRLGHPSLDAEFSKLVEYEKYEIFHAHSPFNMGRFAVKMAKKKKIPVVVSLHTKYFDDFLRATKSTALAKLYLSYVMEVYKKADKVWTVSNAAKSVLKEYGYKGEVDVVRNGTDFTYPENASELIEMVNEKHSLKGEKNVFLFVGRIAMYKGLPLILEALKRVKEHGESFKMIFVGGGFDFLELKKYVKKVGLEKECILTDIVKDKALLQGYYLRSDLMLFPSDFDTSGIVKIEAAAHKTPTVLLKDSCSAEEVIDGENGFLCDRTEESLANKILEIMKNPELYKTVGEKAYKSLYRSWQMVANEVHDKYVEIIKEYERKNEARRRLQIFKALKRKKEKSQE